LRAGNVAPSGAVENAVPGFQVVDGEGLEWDEYERFPGRFKAELTEAAGLRHTRANLIRQEPGAQDPRHLEHAQDETFVPLRGTMTLYLDDPAERHEIPVGGIAHVEAGTAHQMVNESDEDLVVFVYGAPPQRVPADLLDSAV
jgi:uncharacterized cupin superfamily protein